MAGGYDIVIQGGQSNAEGCGIGPVTEAYLPSDDVLYILPDGTIAPAAERVCENGVLGDFSLTFAAEYKRAGLLGPGRKLLIVRAAVGGTGFYTHRWCVGDDLYRQLIETTERALGLGGQNRVAAFLWHQGEQDAFEGSTPEDYHRNFTAMLRSVREKFGAMPFVAGDFVSEWKDQNLGICEPIVAEIRRVVNENPPAAFVETRGLKSNNERTGNGDGIHFCRQSLHELGRLYFNAFRRLNAGDAKT